LEQLLGDAEGRGARPGVRISSHFARILGSGLAWAALAGPVVGLQAGQPEADADPQAVGEREVEAPRPRRVDLSAAAPPEGFVGGPLRGVLGQGSEGRADYRISARLDRLQVDGTERYRLDGRERLVWTNGSSDAVDELWFHVYLNAFSSNRTTLLDASGGVLRGHRMRDGWGWTDIESIELEGEDGRRTDLAPTLSFERPTDGNDQDFTVFRVGLPEVVAPGDSVTVAIEWSSRLPRVRRRTGTKDDFLLVAQWFPKLGVYESGRGWNCHQFHAFSEWYSDFGTYDVSLDLPADFKGKVFGSGVRVRELERGDRVVVDFAAPSIDDRERVDVDGRRPLVHDFMWTADPDFVTRTAKFRFSEWAERFPGEVERARRAFGEDVSLELREVTIEALIQPERASQADRHLQATAAALFFYGLWFGEYPFERLTVVDPAWGASAAGGMEYPTIFTAGTRMYSSPSMHTPESVTIHEAGHQWFYLLSANNEFEAAWLDEGLNSYADSEVLARVYGMRRGTTSYAGVPVRGRRLWSFGGGELGRALTLRSIPLAPFEWVGLDDLARWRPQRTSGFLDYWRDQPLLTSAPELTDPRWADRTSALSGDHSDPIDNWAWSSKSRSSHYTNTYSRTGTILRSMPAFLEAATGEDGQAAFMRAMRGFSEEWRFRHPYPDDFFAALEEHDGLDLELDWFFSELFRSTATVDWSCTAREIEEPRHMGAKAGAEGRWTLDGEEPAAQADEDVAAEQLAADTETTVPAVLSPIGSESEGDERVFEVLVERDGNLSLPVVVRLEFEDGQRAELVWSRAQQEAQRWLRVRYASRSRLVSAMVDPDEGYYIDADRSNNAWYAERETPAPMRWTERVFAQAASFLRWQKGLGG
jgi:hypothetical protein